MSAPVERNEKSFVACRRRWQHWKTSAARCKRSIFVNELIKQINRQSYQLRSDNASSLRLRGDGFYLLSRALSPSFSSAGNKMPRNKNQSQQTIACQKKSIMDASRRGKELRGEGPESRPLRSSKPRFRFCHRHAPPDATVLLMPLPLPLPLKLPLYLRLLLPLTPLRPHWSPHIDGIANAAVLQPKAEVIFQRLCECLSRAASVRECVLSCQRMSVCLCVCAWGDFMTLDSGKRFVALHFQFRSVHFGNFE